MVSFDPHALYSNLCQDLSDSVGSACLDNFQKGMTDWPGISFQERAAASIFTSFLKKLENGMTKTTQQLALDKFLQISQKCKGWEKRMDQFGDDFLLGELRASLNKFWLPNNIDPLVSHHYDILCKGGVGPGAGLGSPGGDFYSKLFSSDLTCTSLSLYQWYKRYTRAFPEWANAENIRLSSYGVPRIVKGNRLSFVPKNDDISRSICTEPVLNMFYQLGFGTILESRLEAFAGIRLKTQQFKNRELARKGSFSDSYVTIDLSSASDSMSIPMLKYLLPPDFFKWLEMLRSPECTLPNGQQHVGGMISTMGNGYTFPLQTILFTCIVLSAFKVDGLAPIFPRGLSEGNFGVNGDDIIVPKQISAKVLRLLHLLGFTPNKDKTFVEGPFRESCGGDYFNGKNLRGVYVKRLTTPQSRYSVINQLNLFSTRTGILLKRTVQSLTKTVKFLAVPLWESDDSGIRVPLEAVRKHLWKDENQSYLYMAWRSLPPPKLLLLEKLLLCPEPFKPRIYNPSGLLISILQGSVNENSIYLKPKVARYSQKPGVTSSWDSLAVSTAIELHEDYDSLTVRLFESRVDLSRFKTVTYLNLFG